MAAAAATVTMTGLQSLRDHGRLKDGGKVLIIGAAGGVGSVSIGIAKKLGAHVAAVCSTKDVLLVEALGADQVVDRKKSDPLDSEETYDVVFDTPAVYSYSKVAKLINQGGAYVTTLPDFSFLKDKIRTLFSSKRCRFIQVASKKEDLELVGGWLTEGLEVPIDSTFKVSDFETALKKQASGERVGKIVIDVANGWE
jgi:NADPH:quinone reductase-like Zn-dependent oxidoreductase